MVARVTGVRAWAYEMQLLHGLLRAAIMGSCMGTIK